MAERLDTGDPDGKPFTFDRKLEFCEHLAKHGRKNEAAIKVGVSRRTVNEHIRKDAIFAANVENAMECFRELLLAELHRRAVSGVVMPVYYKGVRVDQDGEMRQFSDRLLELYIKRHCPEFRDHSVVTNTNLNMDAGLADLEKLTPEQREALRKLLDVPAQDPEVP